MSGPLTTHVPATACPNCGTSLDAATHATEAVAPSPGDLTVCIKCQEILTFDDALHLRKPTKSGMEAIFRDQPEMRDLVFRHQRAAAAAMDEGSHQK